MVSHDSIDSVADMILEACYKLQLFVLGQKSVFSTMPASDGSQDFLDNWWEWAPSYCGALHAALGKSEETVHALELIAERLLTMNAICPMQLGSADRDGAMSLSPRAVVMDYFVPATAVFLTQPLATGDVDASRGAIAEKIAVAWRSKNIDRCVIAPLSHADLIPELEACTLGEFRVDHAPQWLRQMADPFPELVRSASAVLTTRVSVSKERIFADSFEGLVGRVRQAVAALRCVTGGGVACSAVFVTGASPGALASPGCVRILETPDLGIPRGATLKRARVDRTRCAEAVRLAQVWTTTAGQALSLPTERWCSHVSRHSEEDQLIDLVIALESLLLADNEKDQLKRTFQQRGACVLWDDLRGPVVVSKILGDLYDLRSMIVHGGVRLADTKKCGKKMRSMNVESASAFIREVGDMAHRVLRRAGDAVERGAALSSWCKGLDERLLIGLAARDDQHGLSGRRTSSEEQNGL